MAELKAYDQHLRQSKVDDGLTMALLFHGPSGTGKSHLARHIAAMLDREIVFKRGSDLLSKWVGGTEQNIRDAYAQANDNAVLVFDEADSLIFSRDRAEKSWEISHTNEFLTWMEQFRGIQIFTTNRLSDLDSASLRRFNHKIEFKYLTPDGNVTFYKRLLAPMIPSRMTTNLRTSTQVHFQAGSWGFQCSQEQVQIQGCEASHPSGPRGGPERRSRAKINPCRG